MSLIEIEHLRKEYPGAVPLKDVNATVEKGEVISIIGPSGTGKSTLLRCLNLLEKPTSGNIIVDGVDMCDPATDLDAMRRKMGMVFQSFNLFDEPTSVLDPAMVSEVLTVMKSLASRGADHAGSHARDAFRTRGEHTARACELVIDEITSQFLIPAARKHGVEDPQIRYDLSVGEGGEKAQLLVDCKALYDAGVTDGDILSSSDEVSGMVLKGMTSEYTVEEPGLARLTIS